MTSNNDAETNRLLGQLLAEIAGLKERMDRVDRATRDSDQRRDRLMDTILKDIEDLKHYMIENRGGRRMLIMLLTAAGGLGAALVETFQRIFHFR